jgi:2'-5' RNA ligase
MDGRRTALVMLVPEAEAVVSQLRLELDPVARFGVPAHLTVLFPFVPAAEFNDAVMARLAELFRSASAFEYRLVRTEWFGNAVLWLAPDAAEQFRELTSRASTAFPDYLPYEGQFEDVVPHLTVADHGPFDAICAAEQAVAEHLPITSVARAVTLLVEQRSGNWETGASFHLGR